MITKENFERFDNKDFIEVYGVSIADLQKIVEKFGTFILSDISKTTTSKITFLFELANDFYKWKLEDLKSFVKELKPRATVNLCHIDIDNEKIHKTYYFTNTTVILNLN